MYREDKFVLSHRPYAIDLGSLHVNFEGGRNGEYAHARALAVWFRRKNGANQAVAGELWDIQRPAPKDAVQFLEQHKNGRYGGRPFARWDGTSFWCAGQYPEENARYLALLKPMLAEFPACPEGWDGWWRF
ncbi:MAG: hypothetical protein HOY79_17635 [Streptomyces sp.]|nr:hypothetical protein [Streptomyces sp.]